MTGRRVMQTIIVFAAIVLAGCSPSEPQMVTPTFGPPAIRGVAYHGMWTSRTAEDRAAILDAVAAAGIPWVRLDVGWDTLQPTADGGFTGEGVQRLDTRLAEIRQRGLSALVMLWWAPEWSSGTADKAGVPQDPQDYAEAAAWMVQQWPDEIQALQVWNEPDLPEFFESRSAADYAELLKATYPAVKSARPDVTVVSAGPANLDQQWYADFFDADVIGSFDALGAHPYPAVGDLPPAQCTSAPDTGCNMDWLVDYQASRGDDSPIWVTEFGYSVHADTADLEPWQRGVTLQQQAQYTAAMMAYFSTIPQVAAAFVYRDRDFDDSDVHINGFGLLRKDNTPKPVYDVITCSPTARCEELAS